MRIHRSHGLTVLEVLVSIAVLAVAGLGLIAAFTRLLVVQDTSSTQTVARIIAESEVQNAVLAGPDSTVKDRALAMEIGQAKSPTAFLIKAPVFEKLSDKSLVPGSKSMGAYYRVTVQVSWSGLDGQPSGAGRGMEAVEVSRFTYIEE